MLHITLHFSYLLCCSTWFFSWCLLEHSLHLLWSFGETK